MVIDVDITRLLVTLLEDCYKIDKFVKNIIIVSMLRIWLDI